MKRLLTRLKKIFDILFRRQRKSSAASNSMTFNHMDWSEWYPHEHL